MFPLLLVTVVDVPVVQFVQLPRWFAVLGHADDMPVVVNNRCLELDSAEKLQRFQIPMVLTARKNIEILLLQLIDTVADVLFVHVVQVP